MSMVLDCPSSSASAHPWAIALQQPAVEFGPVSLPLLAGQVPPGLRGTLYRNGPGRLQRGGQAVGHWFDGDGAILAVQFSAEAIATYRYVQTAGYQAEERAGRLLYGNYGMTAPGPIWNQWRRAIKNSANTSVLPLGDRLLALWEGAQPHALHLQTLDTLGLDDLGGLPAEAGYSAHPKVDRLHHEVINLGLSIGPRTTLHLYRSRLTAQGSDRPGTLIQQQTHALDGVPLLHDFVVAGPYIVLCIPPVRLSVLPVVVGVKSFSDALTWQPQLGTEIWICDRQDLTCLHRLTVDPWFQWHCNNGHVDDDGQIVLSLIRYGDFQTNQHLKEIATGTPKTAVCGQLWQIRLDPQAGRFVDAEPLVSQSCEFPTVAPDRVGLPQRHTYLSIHPPDSPQPSGLFEAIACFDHHTGRLQSSAPVPGCYPSEPIYGADSADPTQGWLITVVLNTLAQRSEVWIFDAERVDGEPVARLELPQMVPPSFHGAWQAA
jgi:carotenoid cleavage dioxygenase-like enzyme